MDLDYLLIIEEEIVLFLGSHKFKACCYLNEAPKVPYVPFTKAGETWEMMHNQKSLFLAVNLVFY